ncbi:MAG: hypothetical protein JJ879_02275, partial [Sneathiella sp.]|nr:hypothetical protein [Sneathiella sp.]
ILPVGDSNVSLNPLFGQGMTVAFMAIRDLSHLLQSADVCDPQVMKSVRKKYFDRLNRIFQTPWDLAMGQDFRYPETTGVAPFGYRVKNILKGLILATESPRVAEHFFKVVHLIEKETTFYHPIRMLQVLWTARPKR